MSQRQQYNTSARKRRRSPLGRLLTFLVICLVLYLGVSVFFRVSDIRVDGDTRYTSGEVIDASGIEFGTHMFFVSDDTARQNIQRRLPYVGQVEIRRRFPSRVEITVTDTTAIAILRVDGTYILLDRQMKALEILDDPPMQRFILIEGVGTPILPRTGEILAFGEEGREKLSYLQEILRWLTTLEISPWVSVLDMRDVDNPRFIYDDRLTILLGPNRNLRDKMYMLSGILAELEEDERGLIDLGSDRPFFRPERDGGSLPEEE